MRALNPFVFEELLLSAFKQAGYKIKRNRQYTGDGGIDGKVKVNGKWCLVQAKRYKGHIDAQHVKDFSGVCRKKRKNGLFIHTGRTGAHSRKIALSDKRVTIISGKKLISLIKQQ